MRRLQNNLLLKNGVSFTTDDNGNGIISSYGYHCDFYSGNSYCDYQ